MVGIPQNASILRTACNAIKHNVLNVNKDLNKSIIQDNVWNQQQIVLKDALYVLLMNVLHVKLGIQLNHGQFVFIVHTIMQGIQKGNAFQ